MPATALAPHQLRLTIDPRSLGFASTAELHALPLPWIGQDRAQAAAAFGLGLQQPDYHLFVLGEVGSGRSTLMRQAMHAAAAQRTAPPDLCYLHHWERPDHPRALRLPAGQGRVLRQAMADWVRSLHTLVPKALTGAEHKAQAEQIEAQWQAQEADAFAALEQFAKERQFRISRDSGQLVFTLIGPKGQPLTEGEARALPAERRTEIDLAEQSLRSEISRFVLAVQPLEQARDAALTTLRRATVAPVLEQALRPLHDTLGTQQPALGPWLAQTQRALLQQVHLFEPADPGAASPDAEDDRKDDLDDLLAHCHVNLVVDHHGHTHAPVVVEDNPTARNLFGSIEHGADSDVVQADHASIQAGSLLKAHGGFLLLHLHDLAAEEGVWQRLRRFLRSGRLQVEDTGGAGAGGAGGAALQPEAVEVDVKIVLIGSVDAYYALQESDPDAARRFKVKVDFSDQFTATPATHHATAILMAQCCARRSLPHLSAEAVALLLEQSHRNADDQRRQSAQFAQIESLVIESAAHCQARCARAANMPAANVPAAGVHGANGNAAILNQLVSAADVRAAQHARRLRHNQPEEELHESIAEGERLITVSGTAPGQINAMTQIDLGDYRFGFPVRITARTFAGQEGLLNIEREVDMSGPIHDKGVLILHSYLTALFSHVAPLALNASIVFEQEYSGVEGDSASCAELYALLSSLSALPLRQGIAVTGALNQHGEVLPVGGINEKIEGWFQVCQAAGLDGTQGVLIPARNQHHLMLAPSVQDAVERGLFHVYTMGHVSEGIALLTGEVSGMSPGELLQAQADERAGSAATVEDTVLQRAEVTLRGYRRACQVAGGTRRGRGVRDR